MSLGESSLGFSGNDVSFLSVLMGDFSVWGIRANLGDDDLHPSSDVDVTLWHLSGTEEDVAAVSAGSHNFEGVLPAVSYGAVEADAASLSAIRGVDGPCCLVPALFKVVRDDG